MVLPRQTGPSPRSALPLLAASQFLLVLDSAIVNVALPSMQADLGLSAGGVTWVVNAYALLFGGLLLLGGRLADLVGARRVFLAGMTLFGIASAAGALAPTGGALVASRAVQGLGAALVAPGAMALVIILFEPGPGRNRALGLMGSAAGLGGASGAMVGGLLTQAWDWRAILWINVPVVAVVVGRGRRLPLDAAVGSARRLPVDAAGVRDRVDVAGAVTATAGTIALVYGLIGVSGAGLLSARALAPLVLGLLAGAAFVAVERRAVSPLVPGSVLRIRSLRGADVTMLLGSMALMPMWFLLTVYLQQVRGFGPVAAGAGVLPTVAMLVLFNGLAPRVIGRVGTKRPLVLGLLVASAGLAWLSDLGGAGSAFAGDMVWPQVVTGVGFGLAFVAGTVTSAVDAPVELSGIASGLYNSAQQVGGAVGLAVLVTVATHVGSADTAALTADLSRGFLVASAFAGAAAALAWVLVPGGSAIPRAGAVGRAAAPVGRVADAGPAATGARPASAG